MKTIYLIRHAEAAAKQNGLSDYQRPLTTGGVESVNKLGEYLNKASVRFDNIITSHAVRALQTAHGIAGKTDFPENKIVIEKSIYTSGIDSYLDIIFEQPDEMSNLAIIGHNPHITGLANYLMKEELFFLTPSAMVAMKFHTDKWTDICLAEMELFLVWPTL
jgi:phosphohistidine phosphatase